MAAKIQIICTFGEKCWYMIKKSNNIKSKIHKITNLFIIPPSFKKGREPSFPPFIFLLCKQLKPKILFCISVADVADHIA